MKKTRIALFTLSCGVFPLVLGLWTLSVQGLVYINYCPALLPNVDDSPRNEWQIASTRGSIALILVPQSYLSDPGWAADFKSFGHSGLNLKENPCARIVGQFSIGEETRGRAWIGSEKYWALRFPYWAVTVIVLVLVWRLRLYMVRAEGFVNPDAYNKIGT